MNGAVDSDGINDHVLSDTGNSDLVLQEINETKEEPNTINVNIHVDNEGNITHIQVVEDNPEPNIIAQTPQPKLPTAAKKPAAKKKKDAEGPKRGPGRPRNETTTTPVERYGIAQAPVNEDDILELVYDNPVMFKKLMKLYKKCYINEIDILFTPAGFTSITRDKLQKSTIYTTLDGRCMNHFYCKEPVKVCFQRLELEKILTSLNKNHRKITFLLKENFRSIMYVIITNSEYNNDLRYELNLVKRQDVVQELADDDKDYPLRFKFSSTHFKSTVASMKKMSPVFIIQKSGNDPLQLTYDRSKTGLADVYPDDKKLELVHTLADDEVLSCCVSTVYIEPFSTSAIGNDVYFAVAKDKKLSLTTRLDEIKGVGWALQVKSFTEIRDNRG